MDKEKREAYVQWLTKKGKPQLVTPLKFIGLRKNKHDHVVTFYDADGRPYNGEVWDCRTQDGKVKQFTFPVETASQEEVGWSFNSNPIDDNSIYTNQDAWHYDGENYIVIPNECKLTEKEEKVMSFLHNFVNNTDDDVMGTLAQLKLMMLTTPSQRILKEYKDFRTNHAEKHDKLNNLIDGSI